MTKKDASRPGLFKQFLAVLYGGLNSLIKTREFSVVIDPNRSVEDWVRAGRYDFANQNHNSLNLGQFSATSSTDPIGARLVAFSIGRSATVEKAKRVRERLNLKPISWEYLAAIGEQYPEAQRELGWIVSPDTVWVGRGGDRYVSCIFGGPAHRGLGMYGILRRWPARTWFVGLDFSK